MAQKYILLECNRLNAKLNYKNLDESEDQYKNKWVNNVNSYGIVIEPGDIITCESSAINTTGASDSTIEFIGSNNPNGFIDTKLSLFADYYINDTGQTNIKLPLLEAVNQVAPQLDNDAQVTDASLENANNLCNRTLGTVALNNYGTSPLKEGEFYRDIDNIPTQALVYNYELSKLSADIGHSYQIGRIYPTTNAVGGGTGGTNGAGMFIKVLDVVNEGATVATTGIPSKIQIWRTGTGYNNPGAPNNVASVKIGAQPTDGSAPSSGTQVVNFNMIYGKNGFSKVSLGPTGRRYYLPEPNPKTPKFFYTGPCDIQYIEIPNANVRTEILSNFWQTRQTKIDLEIPTGLNTPDNISTILTDQLHEPEKLRPNKLYKYLDYSKYDLRSKNLQDEPKIVKPVIYKTPTYTPMATNMGNLQNIFYPNAYDGARATYYSNIGYDDPNRIAGLSCLNARAYSVENNISTNQFNSGLHQQENIGDYGNQEVGNLGLFTALMCELQVVNNFILMEKGDFLLTNMYFTEDNIRDIAIGFRKAEKFFGDYDSEYKQDYTSPEYTTALGVPLDICRYADNLSNAYPLTTSGEFFGQDVPGNDSVPVIKQGSFWALPNQRQRYKTFQEMQDAPAGTKIYKPVDEGRSVNNFIGNTGHQYDNNLVCAGSVPFAYEKHLDGFPTNDGQELSSFVVQSRFSEDCVFDANNVSDNFINLNAVLTTSSNPTRQFDISPLPDGSLNPDIFNNSYRDILAPNVIQSTKTLMAMAKKYDLAVIPVFPTRAAPGWNKGNVAGTPTGRPYIAFRTLLKVGIGNYDTTKNGLDDLWQIDARNCPYGAPIGYDPSFIRNNATMVINSNYADTKALRMAGNVNLDVLNSTEPVNQKNVYNQVVFMGAVNPSIDFSADLSRFTITGLNTPMTIGNGIPTNNQFDLEANSNPEQQCYNINVAGQLASIEQTTYGITTAQILGVKTYTQEAQVILNEFVPQVSTAIIDSYTGLAINGIELQNEQGITTTLSNGFFVNNTIINTDDPYFNYYTLDILQGTMLGKMGFNVAQLLNPFGSNAANFFNPISFQKSNQTYLEKYLKTPKPQITGAFISSAEYQPSQTNSQDMPLYANGTNLGLPSKPAVIQGSLTAQQLPTKLDYPYLLIYSSIISGGTDTEYYGGLDGKSKLPCVGFITRNYNEGDFFYGLEQSFNYTATKSYTLTDVETEIRLPDGTRPRLDPHNSVIYKITKPQILPPGLNPAINISTNDKNDADRRRRERES